ncbi:MAG: S8 family peptidase [Bacteroidales bacterium]|nr:S8 family peptidase [Bacteroidales bacterium]
MKRIILTFTLVLAALMGKAQATIDRALQEEMNRRGDNEKIEILVLMKAQYDRNQLNRRAEFCPTRAERRDFVVNELKAFAEASQYGLKHTLAEMERHDLVSTPKTLWSANALCFSATKPAILDLAQRNDIEMIGFDHKENLIPETEAARPSFATRETTPNVLQVNADKVWELGYTGEGVIVSVVDSGINYDHLDLADHLWDGGAEFPHHGYDIVNDDNDPMDDQGHGTHCAGTVLGDGTAGSLTGMAPDATLMCVKSIKADGFGGSANIAGGMEWSVEHGCDLISMSLGMVNSEIPDRELLRRTCVSVLDAGIVAAVCAGNEGHIQFYCPVPNNIRVPASCPPPYLDPDQLENPGDLSCVIAVGAVGSNDEAAYFSSHGPVTWTNTEFGDYAYDPGIGLIRPDLCAPGVAIKSLDYLTTNGYCDMDGTSQATPCVAGIIALMLQKNPDLLPADICHILEETSVKLSEHKSNVTGIGRIDALAAIEQVPAWDKVNEQIETQAFVYPNPTRDQFTVECESMTEIAVYSMDGKLVKHMAANGNRCSIEGLSEGVYLVKVMTERGTIVRKMMVM